jgi:adenylate cyclase, class 2
MQNIEIKAKYTNHDKARQLCEDLGAACLGTMRQIDTYFRVQKGRLKLREKDVGTAELIAYVRPDQENPKCSEFVVIDVDSPTAVKEIFSTLLGVETVVEKSRTIYVLGSTRIHIDEVDGMGRFLEIEVLCGSGDDAAIQAATIRARELMEAFEIFPKDLIPGSYRELRLGGA